MTRRNEKHLPSDAPPTTSAAVATAPTKAQKWFLAMAVAAEALWLAALLAMAIHG